MGDNKIETYVFLDLESTGLGGLGQRPRITELSLVAVHLTSMEGGASGMLPRVMDKMTLCVYPQKSISPTAASITGLYNDMLDCQKTFDKDLARLLQLFLTRHASPICLVAHNGFKFDYPLLKSELESISETFPSDILCSDTIQMLRSMENEKLSPPAPVGLQKTDVAFSNKDSWEAFSNVTPCKPLTEREMRMLTQKHGAGDFAPSAELKVSSVKRKLFMDAAPPTAPQTAKRPATSATGVSTRADPRDRSSPTVTSSQETVAYWETEKSKDMSVGSWGQSVDDGITDSVLAAMHIPCGTEQLSQERDSAAREGSSRVDFKNASSSDRSRTITKRSDSDTAECRGSVSPEIVCPGNNASRLSETAVTQETVLSQSSPLTPCSMDNMSSPQSGASPPLTDLNLPSSQDSSKDSIRDRGNLSSSQGSDSLPATNRPVTIATTQGFCSIGPTRATTGRKSLALDAVHQRLFGYPPPAAHRAEDDCLALLRVFSALAPNSYAWVNKNAVPWDSVEPMYRKKPSLSS